MMRVPEPEYMDLPEEAAAYAAADFTEVNRAFAEALCACASEGGYKLVLDLGTGPGDIPACVASMHPGWHIVGLDASCAMLEFAAKAAAGMRPALLSLVLADAKRLPFPAASFDGVYSNSILHHVEDVDTFWREIRRVTQPGGFIFLRDLMRPASPDAAHGIVMQHAGTESPLLREEFYRSLLAAYTPDEVQTQLAAAGLDTLCVAAVTDRHLDVYGRLSRYLPA